MRAERAVRPHLEATSVKCLQKVSAVINMQGRLETMTGLQSRAG